MKGVDGIEATRGLRAAGDTPPCWCSLRSTTMSCCPGALRAGARDSSQDSPAEDLIRAVRAVAGGEAWLDPAVTARVLRAYRTTPTAAPGPRPGELTAREHDVLRMMGRGLGNSEIAQRSLSPS